MAKRKTKWVPFLSGPYAGKTAAEVFLRDPAYLVAFVKHGSAPALLLAQARGIVDLAARVCPPVDDDEAGVVDVFYFLLPSGAFSGHGIVSVEDPEHESYVRAAAAVTSQRLDVTLPLRLAPNDPDAGLVLIRALKLRAMGNPNAVLTAAQCAAFFDAEDNFVDAANAPVRISYVMLRNGTRYREYVDRFNPHALKTLDAPHDVEVLKLALHEGEDGCYLLDGRVIAVAYKGEVRGPRAVA